MHRQQRMVQWLMNMNIHINRQVEEADGCWPVTFALPNISTEGKLCPGSATRAACCKVKPGFFFPLLLKTHSKYFIFLAPALSHYRLHDGFDISLINSYPTILITVVIE